jgi:FKBP-type peptidyl-prolyl cis-trans isomerase SlyD
MVFAPKLWTVFTGHTMQNYPAKHRQRGYTARKISLGVPVQISRHKVVTLDYILTDERGSLLDSSQGTEPLAYIHGTHSLIPGLEKALEGKSSGESFKVLVPPEEAYGHREQNRVQNVSREELKDVGDIEIGMRLQRNGRHGPEIVTVTSMDEKNVTVDANHPLAGMILNFKITIVGVREATEEELSHDHVHGEGGHSH